MVFERTIMKIKNISPCLIAILTLSLLACDGGGSGGGTLPTPSPSPSPSGGGTTGNWYCQYTTSPTYLNTTVSSSSTAYVPIPGGVTSSGYEACATSSTRTVTGNGIPNHATGIFPSSNDPNPLTTQNISFITTLNPVESPGVTYLTRTPVGYLNNGVKLDPGTAATVCNNGTVVQAPTCPWNLEAIVPVASTNVQANLGIDQCNGHTQPGGWYHYHGLPTCFISTVDSNASTTITLIGWAADGFPIYNNYGYNDPNSSSSTIRKMRPSWHLIPTSSISPARQSLLATYPLGNFTQDYVYEAGYGDLDECNGRIAVTPQFPQGIYQYYTTESFPYIQRCIHGTS